MLGSILSFVFNIYMKSKASSFDSKESWFP
jgi:hypothetical protein